MVSSDQSAKTRNHIIFMLFTATQSCSALLCHAPSFGVVLRVRRAETSATGWAAVHRPEKCWALWLVSSCRFLEQWNSSKEKMQQDSGKGSVLYLTLLKNLPHCRQILSSSSGATFLSHFTGHGLSTSEGSSRKKTLSCPWLVSAEGRSYGFGPVSLMGRSLFDLSPGLPSPLSLLRMQHSPSLSYEMGISKCYLRKHMFSPLKAAPPLPLHTNTFLYSTQTSPRGICNNCGDKSARR